MKAIDLNNKTIFITGAAGFIGGALSLRLLESVTNAQIIGVDSLNDYYDPALKHYRLSLINEASDKSSSVFHFHKGDIADGEFIASVFDRYSPSIVINLAAQAGVRYSITQPDKYISSNIIGFYNILEGCRGLGDKLEHLVYASSSSIYGNSEKSPLSVEDKTDQPVSLYAATKKSNELLAYSYSKLYNIPSTGLRFFTVYGPAGRPDMAYFSFTQRFLRGEKIRVFNYGNCERDFTYIDDITEAIVRAMKGAPDKMTGADGLPAAPYSIYNVGHGDPVNLLDFVRILSEELIRAGLLPQSFDFNAHASLVPMQPGDVASTFADTRELEKDFGFRPFTELREGLRHFSQWYAEFYKA